MSPTRDNKASDKGDANEDAQLRPGARVVARVLSHVVTARPRALGPRPHARAAAARADLVRMEPRPARVLVSTHVARVKKDEGPGACRGLEVPAVRGLAFSAG